MFSFLFFKIKQLDSNVWGKKSISSYPSLNNLAVNFFKPKN